MSPVFSKHSLLCGIVALAWSGSTCVWAADNIGGNSLLPPPGNYQRNMRPQGDERPRSLRDDMIKQQGAPSHLVPQKPPEPPPDAGLRRLSPEERKQLRRDVRDAGRDVYNH